jgi:predicted HicB family RNase H-like nuclease/uncharacterized coiled-coil protein SlyX
MNGYKGYSAAVEYDVDSKTYFGRVLGLRDVVTFQANDQDNVEAEFHASVDDYLDFCAKRGEEPERPYSGKFLLRLPGEMHKAVYLAAAEADVSMNQLIVDILEERLQVRSTSSGKIGTTEPPSSSELPDKSAQDETLAELSELMAMQATMAEALRARAEALKESLEREVREEKELAGASVRSEARSARKRKYERSR